MRVQRIIKPAKQKPRLGEKIAAMLFVLTTFTFFAFQSSVSPEREIAEIVTEIQQPQTAKANIPVNSLPENTAAHVAPPKKSLTDTVPTRENKVSKMRITTNHNGKTYYIESENDALTKLKINGKTIPPQDYDRYRTEVNTIIKEAKDMPPPPPPPSFKTPSAPPSPDFARPMPPAPPPPPPAPERLRSGENEDLTHLRESRDDLRERLRELRTETAEIEKLLHESEREKHLVAESLRAAEEMMREMSEEEWLANREAAIEAMSEARLLQAEDLAALEEHRRFITERRKDALMAAAESQRHNHIAQVITEELERDGLYNDGKFRFKMDEDKLRINGKKQPDAVYRKYRNLYRDFYPEKADNFGLHINSDGRSHKTSVQSNSSEETQ